MSSVFLFVAIVAIWAFVLVPRWLRHHHAQPQSDTDETYDAESTPVAAEQDDETPHESAADDSAQPPRQRVVRDRKSPSLPRSHMMQARRRLLTVLLVLAAAAGACAGAKVAPIWVCIPPATVLCVYVLLLRETSRADSERVRRYAAAAEREARLQAAARRRAHEAALAEAAQPSAEIIDISARVGDQLYDQYADATVRAVGD